MSVHQGHRGRLRARFLKDGLAGFEEHNALELLLFYARPRQDTNELAHALIKRFGSFAAVLDAPVEELMKVKGMGETSAVLLKLIPPMSGYYLESRTEPGAIMNTTQAAGNFFMPKFFAKQNEEVHLAALDDKRKVLRSVCISEEGITNAVTISVKRVVAEAVRTNATGIVLAHNHPGGLALPSPSDKKVTAQVFRALRLINVQLVDHIIVADGDYVSLADSGYIAALQGEEY
ncbi:DNA repair protein RadC [Ruminococcaceae bacterium OttesenSCG-928-A16]|nr:DNA repair protein RadC [Ruminococcaceae bacterium OttesenSCG-928-A16]